MAGFDDPSIRDLHNRLNDIKKGPHTEEAKITSINELELRLKEIKNLPNENEMTDDKLQERFQKIATSDDDDAIVLANKLNEAVENGKIDVLSENVNNNDNPELDILKPFLQPQNTTTMGNDGDDDGGDDDDFELFLAEAGISDKVIVKITKCATNTELKTFDDDMTILNMETALAPADHFAASFENFGDVHDGELSQVMNQAMDELRLLPSHTYSQSYPADSSLMNLQDEFDSDVFENDEIRRLVSEAQDLAALERKYNSTNNGNDPSVKSNTNTNTKVPPKSSHYSASSSGMDYYYRVQAHNITKERDRRKKSHSKSTQRHRQRSYSSGSDSSSSSSSCSSNHSDDSR